MPWHASATISGLKKEPSGHPGQVDYPSGQASFHSIGKGPGKSLTGQAEFESYLQLMNCHILTTYHSVYTFKGKCFY